MSNIKENVCNVEGQSFEGTIIDLETVGPIHDGFKGTERYKEVKPYLFGYLTGNVVIQKYVEKYDHIPVLLNFIREENFGDFLKPLYAFFVEFETGVIYCSTGRKLLFDRELKEGKGSKEDQVKKFGISNYDDPFPGQGVKLIEEFKKGNITDPLRHNKACLLKERDIFFERGYVNPPQIDFHQIKGY
jgi:hypothetical protein